MESEILSGEQTIAIWDRYRGNPIAFVREVLGWEVVETYQEKILRAIQENERVAVRSCHCMGKTKIASGAVLWFTPNHPQSKTVSTAPTGRQVKLLLWSEIRAGHARAKFPLGGELSTVEWKIEPDWFSVGFTTQKDGGKSEGQSNSGFQGIHAEGGVFVLFDEATGIPADIWKQLEGLMTSANVRFVAFGNPTTKACEFYKCFSDASFVKVHLSCFDSPNLIASGITDKVLLEQELAALQSLNDEDRLKRLDSYPVVRPYLLTTKWVMSMALKWGTSHPLFVSKAYGEFPDEDDSALMPLGVVEAAQRRDPTVVESSAKISIGVDVARFGSDRTIITVMHGPVVKAPKPLVKKPTTEVSGTIIKMVNEFTSEQRQTLVITVDATGIGSGVVDELREYQREHILEWGRVEIREMHFGETFKVGRDGSEHSVKERAEQYVNKKAEAFVMLAQDLKTEIVLPDEDIYLGELPTIIYRFNKGRWEIEDKEAYKRRTKLPSPDYSDSLALANYGRYHTSGAGTFSAEMGKPTGKPLAPGLNSGEDW